MEGPTAHAIALGGRGARLKGQTQRPADKVLHAAKGGATECTVRCTVRDSMEGEACSS